MTRRIVVGTEWTAAPWLAQARSSGLGEQARTLFDRCWEIDLQMLRTPVQPWPAAWPTTLLDLNVAAAAAGIAIPPRAPDQLHPRVHAEWNRRLFDQIRATGTL